MKIEVFRHNDLLISIKDLVSDIDISDAKWDFIFNQNKRYFAFNGFRLLYEETEIISIIKTYAKSNLVVNDDLHNVFFTIDGATLTFNRTGIKSLWNSYEYPSFILLNDQNEIEKLCNLCINKKSAEEIVKEIKDIIIVYKDFEENVIWIAGSNEKILA